jgi:hypothetical protein
MFFKGFKGLLCAGAEGGGLQGVPCRSAKKEQDSVSRATYNMLSNTKISYASCNMLYCYNLTRPKHSGSAFMLTAVLLCMLLLLLSGM